MKGAGKDCTALFNQFHAWVNVESMLAKCLIGTLVPDDESASAGSSARDGSVCLTKLSEDDLRKAAACELEKEHNSDDDDDDDDK